MHNEKERTKWMNERMAKGWSFNFIKDPTDRRKQNIGIRCIEDNAEFYYDWKDPE